MSVQTTDGRASLEREWNAIEVVEAEAPGLFEATIKGIAPLLMHNPTGMGGGAKTIPTPEEEAEAGLYRWGDGQLFLPPIAVERAAQAGGSSVKYANVPSSRRYGSRKLIEAGLHAIGDGFGLVDADGAPITTWRVDTQRVILKSGNKKVGVLRSRALIPEWQALLRFTWDPAIVGEALVRIALDSLVEGGKTVGLLDYRPRYGRFTVVDARWQA